MLKDGKNERSLQKSQRMLRISKYAPVAMAVFFIFGYFLLNIASFLFYGAKSVTSTVYTVYPWLFVSYFDYGFVRRGMIGTLLSSLPDNKKHIFYVMFVFLSIIVTFYTLYSLYKKSNRAKAALIILWLFAISPLGAMQFGCNFGRFEFINYLIIILSVFSIARFNCIFISPLMVVGLLVHEAFIFYGWPLVFSVVLDKKLKEGKGLIRSVIEVFGVFAIPVIFAVLLFFFGNSNVNAEGANRAVFEVLPFYYKNNIPYLAHSVAFVYILTIFCFHKYVYNSNKHPIDSFFLAPYACLSLFLFGIDYMRWSAILFFVVCFSLLYKYTNNEFNASIKFGPAMIISLSILGFPFLGPIGTIRPFPALQNFVYLLLNRF